MITLQTLVARQIQNSPPLFTSKPLYIALMALTLLLTVFMLQALGLFYAVGAAKDTTPSMSWCSLIFQPFGVAVLDGNCNVWPIEQTFAKGVGCIFIPGTSSFQAANRRHGFQPPSQALVLLSYWSFSTFVSWRPYAAVRGGEA